MVNGSERYKQRLNQLKEAKYRSAVRQAHAQVKPQRVRRQNVVFDEAKFSSTSILLTGGLGDVLAIEAFFSDGLRNKLQTICYATQKSAMIHSCFKALPNYKATPIIVWSEFNNFWCFYTKEEVQAKFNGKGGRPPTEFYFSQDYSINTIFPRIRNRDLAYNGSSFVNHKLTDITDLKLPARYLTVAPYSSDKRNGERDFKEDDWNELLKYANQHQLPLVVLNDKAEQVPSDPLITDLSGRTTVVQALEVVKAGCGYVGIDSSVSVIAAKLFTKDKLAVRSRNGHCYAYQDIYYAPQTDFSFIARSVDYSRLKAHEITT
jgi:hypothetical protein